MTQKTKETLRKLYRKLTTGELIFSFGELLAGFIAIGMIWLLFTQ